MTAVVMWCAVALVALGEAATILMIGQPRRPISPGAALVTTIFNVGFVLAFLYLGGAL